ncbi:MAG TPA: carnitine 3-dehydrogenase [Stellaceae bacterium]|nr:carnitine 3-dehydrogenase [Stellaceae bacterium]
MGEIKTAALVGGGVIGAGWGARFLLNGIDVAVYDPDPELQRKFETVLANARRAWAKLFPAAELPREGSLRIASSLADAVKGADFVQESLPEREDLKRRIFAEIDGLLPPHVIIGSSTSGLLPSRLQSDMLHPERLVVGHPFNPVYLLPLVEICGGEKTAAEVKERAGAFYKSIGMQPLHVRKEIDGFIADRMLEAVWREALWMINDGIATTEEIDDAIRYGAGLRWSFMGTFLIYRLAGGEPGMRHFMSQFGPALKLPWTKLVAPELTDELTDTIVRQSDDQARGVSIRELERRRDDCLVAVMSALRDNDFASGATIKDYERSLVDESGVLTLHRATVKPDWIDYNGHMTEHRYLQVFGETTDALFQHIGADAAYLASGLMYYTVETHIRHLHEVTEGEALHATTQILAADDKRIHLFHAIYRSRDDQLLATAEQMQLHVDTNAKKAAPARADVLERVRKLAQAHSALPRPEGSGRSVGVR